QTEAGPSKPPAIKPPTLPYPDRRPKRKGEVISLTSGLLQLNTSGGKGRTVADQRRLPTYNHRQSPDLNLSPIYKDHWRGWERFRVEEIRPATLPGKKEQDRAYIGRARKR